MAASIEGFTEHLTGRGVDGLADLLERRGDLAVPAPVSVRALAARATTRASLERALSRCDTATLAALDAVVALGAPTTAAVTAALAVQADDVLAQAEALALVVNDNGTWLAAPGLADLLAPHPAGQGPGRVSSPTTERSQATPLVAPQPVATPIDPRTAAADAATHALEAVRLVAALLDDIGHHPVPARRAGGLGVREIGRLAGLIEISPAGTTVLIETAAHAQLIADDATGHGQFCMTTLAEVWVTQDACAQWSDLARPWLTSDRAPWLVGGRDRRGDVLPALDPATRRSWLPKLRTEILTVLADASGALDAAAVHEVLVWHAPRSAPPQHTVTAVLEEAALLGMTGAGVLSPAGRAVLDDVTGTGTADPAQVLAADLPAQVDEVLLGADLTGVVPGRPTQVLGALLESAAQVESRGAGLTVRFTDASIRSALGTRSADQLLRELAAHARGPIPQPLEYLIADVARRHTQVHPAAAGEDASGQGTRATSPRRVRVHQRPTLTTGPGRDYLLRVAAGVLTSHPAAGPEPSESPVQNHSHNGPAGAAEQDWPGTTEPTWVLAVLREAIAERCEVWLDIAGPSGITRRKVRPLRVDAGRVRVLDASRSTELTVATHRLAAAVRVEQTSATSPDVTGEAWTAR